MGSYSGTFLLSPKIVCAMSTYPHPYSFEALVTRLGRVVLWVKNLLASAGDVASIPESGRSAEGGNGNPLQYSHLENPMDRGAWWSTVRSVSESRT